MFGIVGGAVVLVGAIAVWLIAFRGSENDNPADNGNNTSTANNTAAGSSGGGGANRVNASNRNQPVPQRKPKRANPVTVKDVSVRRLSNQTFAVDFAYEFQGESHSRYSAFEVSIDFTGDRTGWGTTAAKLAKNGRFQETFQVPRKTSPGKIPFTISVSGSTRGRFGPFQPISPTFTGTVADDGVLELTANELDRKLNYDISQREMYNNAKVKVTGRVTLVSDIYVMLFARRRSIKCRFATSQSSNVKSGEDLTITGRIQKNGSVEILLADCKIVGRGQGSTQP